MLRRAALVRTYVSEEISASFIRGVTLLKRALCSSETSVLTRVARRDIPEDTILHSHRRENLKSYKLYYELQPVYRYSGRLGTLRLILLVC
jgi:hypothetical protein